MDRGYLWQDLASEVREEFEHLTQLVRLRTGFSIVDLDKRAADLARLAALRATGCVRCGAPTNGKARCAAHLEEAKLQARWRRTMAKNETAVAEEEEPHSKQEKLPRTRGGMTHHFVIFTKKISAFETEKAEVEEVDGYLTVGQYPDGRVGEIFLKCGKEGGEHAMLNQWAIAFSKALQHGADLNDLCKTFIGAQFDPAGMTKTKDIGEHRLSRCTSPVDYVCRFLLARFGSKKEIES